jgi:PKD repeat protein
MTTRRAVAQGVLTVVVVPLLLARCRDDTLPPAPTAPSPPRSEQGVLVSAAPEVFVGAGDIARCDRTFDEATAALLDGIPGTVFVLGDNAYPKGSARDYACFHASWGRHKARIKPAAGDGDYSSSSSATPYFDYFGAAAGERGKGYYSYDLGAWHIIVLNTKLSTSAGSAQEQWLRADLKANTHLCTMVIGHYPRFYTGSSSGRTSLRPVWKAMYEAGAELYISAHNRIYERFASQDTAANPDPAYGITQFIVATGGISHGSISSTTAKNSVVRDHTSYGVIKFTLHAESYAWEFVPIAGNTFTDPGSATCHRGRPPLANAGGPYVADGAITFDASASSDPGGNTPLTYAWDFGDGHTGDGVTPTHTYEGDGSYTVTLTVTNSRGASSTATTTATSGNVAPTVRAGGDGSVGPGETYTLSASFSDAGADDAPWGYTLDWGDGSAPETRETRTQSEPITASHVYALLGQYTVRVTVTDKDGASAWDEVTVTVTNDTAAVLIAAGDIAFCSRSGDEATAAILDTIPGTIITLGDNVYEDGTIDEFNNCYAPSWGRHKARTRPALGNHEYHLPGAHGYYQYFGKAAGDSGKYYYSFDVGKWHVIALNGENTSVGAPGINNTSAQMAWLRADLAATTAKCVIAYMHRARWSNGDSHGSNTSMRFVWQALYERNAEIVLGAHDHNYERFAPQDTLGNVDAARGIRQFVVGTGSFSLDGFVTPLRHSLTSEVRLSATGVLKLVLKDGSYSWSFISAPSGAVLDSGTGSCH